jgi:hypothetical protein
MAVQQSHQLPQQLDPAMMVSPRPRVQELQRSDINQMSSGQLAKALGVIPEDRDAWNKLVFLGCKWVNGRCVISIVREIGRRFHLPTVMR